MIDLSSLRLLARLLLAAGVLAGAHRADAHPAPFSYLDLHLDAAGASGTLVVHDFDAAHDLEVASPDTLLDARMASGYRDALVALLSPRMSLIFDGRNASITWGAMEVMADRQSLRLGFTIAGSRPARLGVVALVFPYDPIHQTFVNVYEEGALKHQAILDADHRTLDYYSGTPQGRWAVVQTFALSGVQHILIGPDHILFLVGLLLLGGGFGRLAAIVTAFTVGHSITLSLAALDVVSPPSRLIEPLIALTIILVGADNLLVLRATRSAAERDGSTSPFEKTGNRAKTDGAAPRATPQPAASRPSDIRAWLAAGFGLVHGFGFASVLKEFGLPRAALGWSLFSFNLGVEIGQLAIVTVVAGSLAVLARRRPSWTGRVAFGGSIGVILAGLYWFVERVFLRGAV